MSFIGNYLPLTGGTLTGDLLFTDATYDIGKTGATRPRDLFLSRNLTVGGTAAITGAITASATVAIGGAAIAGSAIAWTGSGITYFSGGTGTTTYVDHIFSNAGGYSTGTRHVLEWQGGGGALLGRFGMDFDGTNAAFVMRDLYAGGAGSTEKFRWDGAGIMSVVTDRFLVMTNQTSSAAAQTGTLTNAPAAGNPGYWLKVKINGTNYAIPCWAG